MLNNLGMGLVYRVKDSATGALTRISAGITNVTREAQRAASRTPRDLATVGRATGRTFTGGATAMQRFGETLAWSRGQASNLASSAGAAFGRLAQSIRAPVDRLQSLKALLTGVAAAWGGLKVVQAAAFEESVQLALAVMLKSEEAGRAVFLKARQFADVTPFDTQQVLQATRLAVSSRFKLNDIFGGGLLRDMGDLAAANQDMGISINEVGRVFARLKAGDFGEAFERLRDMQIGFQDLQQAGLDVRAGGVFTGLDADKVVAAVRSVVQQRFGGMMDKMQASWTGVWSTFTSNITNTFAAIGQAKLPSGVAVLDAIKERVKALTGMMVDSQGQLTPGMQKVVNLAGRAFSFIATAWDWIGRVGGRAVELVRVLLHGFGRLPDASGALQAVGRVLEWIAGILDNPVLWLRAGQYLRAGFDAALAAATWLWGVITAVYSEVATFVGWLNSGSAGARVFTAVVLGLGTALGIMYLAIKSIVWWQQLQVAWTTALTVASGAWATVQGFLNAAVGAFNLLFVASPLGWIALAIGAIIGVVYLAIKYWDQWTGALVRFGEWAGNLAKMAVEWGANFMTGFIDGITAGWTSLINALKRMAGAIKDFLGFSSPTRLGPGSESDTWAPNFMRMYTEGIEAGVPAVTGAGNRAAAALSGALTPTLTPAGVVTPGPAADDPRTAQGARAGQPAMPTPITVVAKLFLPDGRELAEAIIPILREEAQLAYGG